LLINILLPNLRGGGAERVSLDLAYEFQLLGHQVEFVLMMAEGEFLSEATKSFPIFDMRVSKARWLPLRLARHMRKRRPDLLIANMWPVTSAAVLGCWLSSLNTSLLLVEHNTLSAQYKSWGQIHNLMLRLTLISTYRLADHVAAVSQGSADDLQKLAGLAPGRVAVLYNPIRKRPVLRFEEIAAAERLWGCPSGERILTVGSLKEQKNHRLLMRAFKALKRPAARLMFLGSGDDSFLHSLAAELGIFDQIIFSGFHKEPAPFYETADLFVLSSDYEGFGNVIVEAMSFGTPIVSTDCPFGPAEILENGRWGTLVPVGNAEALTKAINNALNSSVDRAVLKIRASDFSPEIAARKYLDLLNIKKQ